MRIALLSVVCASAAVLSAGCVVRVRPVEVGVVAPAPVVVAEAPAVEVAAPVVEVEPPLLEVGVGVEVVAVEPAIAERIYVYDPGFPPGCYVVGGWYYYGGQRYSHDVFVDRVVNVNIRENRFTNVEENRRVSEKRQEAHRREFAKTGGRHPERAAAAHHAAAEHRAAEHKAAEHAEHKTAEHGTEAAHGDNHHVPDPTIIKEDESPKTGHAAAEHPVHKGAAHPAGGGAKPPAPAPNGGGPKKRKK